MSTDVTLKFADNWNKMQGVSAIEPNQEKIEVAMAGQQVEAQPEKPQPSKIDIGSANLAGNNLRNDYQGNFCPRGGDISMVCNELSKDVSELFGALGLSSEPEAPAPDVAAPHTAPNLQANYRPAGPSAFI